MTSTVLDYLKHHWFYHLLQMFTLIWVIITFKRIPPPGYAVAVLALLAAGMSIQPEMNGWQKAVWMLLIGVCLFVEMRAIRADREKVEEETKETRKEEREKFEAIAQKLELSIQRSQRQFDETMSRTNQVFDNVTGGSAYAVVFPHTFGQVSEFPTLIENRGDNVLTGVSVMFTYWGAYVGKVPQFILDAVNNRVSVGTIAAEQRIWTNARIQVDALPEIEEKGEKFKRAYIIIYAQNFSVQEYLDFKQVDGKWLFRYSVYRNLSKKERKVLTESGGKIHPNTKLEEVHWTSDFDHSTSVK